MALTSPQGTIPKINRYGLTQVYSPEGGSKVDIVLVHGLNGDPQRTWTAEQSHIFWPSQLLPPILEEEKARVLVYGYDADVTTFHEAASKDKIHNHAEHLVAQLHANRRIKHVTETPIIFVAHSLGGLVVKRALIYSSEMREPKTEHLRSIFVSTFGILFLGTPHRGSNIAKWGSVLESITRGVLPSGVLDSNPHLVNALQTESETLQIIDRQFYQILSRFHVYFFHEGKKTNLGKMKMQMIVDEESASPNAPDVERAVIQQDHRGMSRFESEDAPGFDLVAEGIQRYASEAPAVVQLNWEQEKAERLAQRRATAQIIYPGGSPHTDSTSTTTNTPETSQLLQPPKPSPKTEVKDTATNTPLSNTTSKPSEPFFIVPPGFRRNTYFVGMEKDYKELDRRLFDKRRRDGTASVLLHGQPGCGKTHLARQYVFKEKAKFAGGIFWITSKSLEEMYHGFWNIRQRVVARDAPELYNEQNGVESSANSNFVATVKTWFQARQDWLLVFDGVTLEKDEDATEMNKFIPDSKESSILYISRAKNLESKQRLLRPFPIKVGPLKEDDATKLLFKTLHIKKPTETEHRKASELVAKVGGLPLAIDAIAHRISDTHEPLARFKLSYSNSSGLESTYNQIFDDLLKFHENAWNMINILCFFGQHIPVELVHLGLGVLRHDGIEVKSVENGGQADLNNTFSILMRNALIERNEPETDKDSVSSSHDSLLDPEPIDMLKVHGVVQSFCCDTLNARQLLPLWLGYAVSLFSYSYHQADIKIKRKSEVGRVSDYRYYLVHAKRLIHHTHTYDSKTQDLGSLRDLLLKITGLIDEEIQRLEPSSSEESVKEGIFRISIFDRTSSSSDSIQSIADPRTPGHYPTPPPLHTETVFGLPRDKPAVNSPASLGTASPHLSPRILDTSPSGRYLHFDDDPGYESDSEARRAVRLSRTTSANITPQPSPRPRAVTIDSQDLRPDAWALIPSRVHRRLPRSSFRPTPVGANAVVSTSTATGAFERKQVPRYTSFDELQALHQKASRRGSSPAADALRGVQLRDSPPQSSKAGSSIMPGFLRRWSAGKPALPSFFRGQRTEDANKEESQGQRPITAPGIATKYSPPTAPVALQNRPGNVQQQQGLSSSPLATEYRPQFQVSRAEQGGMPGDFTLYPTDENTNTTISAIRQRNAPPLINSHSDTLALAYPTRPPPEPSYTAKPPRTGTAVVRSAPTSQRTSPSYQPLPYYAPQPILPTSSAGGVVQGIPVLPTGYSSQPMSRDNSNQSIAYSIPKQPQPQQATAGLSSSSSYRPASPPPGSVPMGPGVMGRTTSSPVVPAQDSDENGLRISFRQRPVLPYPPVNLIPTGSDNATGSSGGGLLEAMVPPDP